jgi:hypothetical protein
MVVELEAVIVVAGANHLQVVLQVMRHRRTDTGLLKARIGEHKTPDEPGPKKRLSVDGIAWLGLGFVRAWSLSRTEQKQSRKRDGERPTSSTLPLGFIRAAGKGRR